MQKTVYVSLPESVITTLTGVSKGNVSKTIRDMLQDFDMEEVSRNLDMGRIGCRIDSDTKDKLAETAKELNVEQARLVRAIIETKLSHMH